MHGRAWAEIDLSAARANVAALRGAVGPERLIMAVVKADAYGHGAAALAPELERAGVDRFAVADTVEAREIREAGVKAPIHTLGALLGEECRAAVELGVIPTIASAAEAEAVAAASREARRKAKVHLNVDTGMGRYGVRAEEVLRTAEAVSALCEIEGLSTHFADAEGDRAFTRAQISRFERVVAELASAGIKPPLRHAANSPGVVLHPGSHFNMIRPGLTLYGLSYSDEMSRMIELRPIMTWKSRVVFAKTIRPGETVGYGRTWSPPEPRVIATVSIGYADGYPRTLSGRGAEVILRGKLVPVVGRVSMDYITIDPTGVDFEIGDEVVLMGRQGEAVVRGERLAELAGTIPHVLVTCMGRRTKRVYVGG